MYYSFLRIILPEHHRASESLGAWMSRPLTAVVNINFKVILSFYRHGDKSLVGFTTLPLASASCTLYWGQVTHHLSGQFQLHTDCMWDNKVAMDDQTWEDDNEKELLKLHCWPCHHDLACASWSIKKLGVRELNWPAQGPDCSATRCIWNSDLIQSVWSNS